MKTIVYVLKGIVAEASSIDQVTPLIAAIKTTINPPEWDTMGGKGAISAFLPSPDNWWRLVVRCEGGTAPLSGTHKEIHDLLEELKKAAD